MSNFVEIPNLPQKKASAVIVDCRISMEAINTLHNLGICVYTTQRISSLYDAVCAHPDMAFFHAGGNLFISSEEGKSRLLKIPGIEIREGRSKLKSTYPGDIAYNAARVGNFLIHNFKHTDPCILSASEDLIRVQVNQGYAKCSVCVVSDRAIITSDMGIAKKCDTFGIDVLKTDDSDILLKGVSHGFFGGASGKIAQDILAVNGNIKTHRDSDKIEEFCDKYGVKIISLHNGAIYDIGTVFCVKEG